MSGVRGESSATRFSGRSRAGGGCDGEQTARERRRFQSAHRDERLDSFVDDFRDPHTVSLRCSAKPPHRWSVKAIERPSGLREQTA
jgi:hypothetical protein